MRRDALGPLVLLMASVGCEPSRAPRLAPDQLAVDDQARPLALSGLDPADYLEPVAGRLALTPDFVATIGGAPTAVTSADGTRVELLLGRPLPVGAHDLDLVSSGQRWQVAGALRVVELGAGPDARADAVDGDATPADGPRLPSCPGNGALIACYPFDGDSTDASPNQLDAIASAVTFAAGPSGQAIDLRPTSRVEVADDDALDSDDLTLQAWVYLRALPANRAMIVDNQLQYGLWISATGALVCSTGGQLTSPAPLTVGGWHHVACTSDRDDVRLYLDGVEVAQRASLGVLPTVGSTGLSIGGDNPGGADDRLDGLLDELRLYRIARSAADLCADAGLATCP